MTNATTTEAVITQIKKYPYDFDPGTKWDYDNSGYLLLGYIVEKVSGQSYEDFLREKFFQPLGMTNTGVYRSSDPPHKALGYSPGKNGFERAQEWEPSWCGGAGGLCSTVEDLYRWNEGLFNGLLLDAASLKAAFTPVKGSEGQVNWDAGYGCGWFVGHYRGRREISHDGGVPGFASTLMRLPNEKFTVAILANTQQPHVASLLWARQLVTIFLADKLAPLPTVNTNVSPKSYEALSGRFALEKLGVILNINRRGTHLFEQIAGGTEREIFPKSDIEFFVKGVDTQITFEKDSGGKASN
jgi:CubicO group peptidase (beta-lactamase class C family)